ncbi:MAG TPA: hypothetical protein P5218_05235, partial [Planctomycetota bacterium]|nr:hypothetical protein [Planctomycetota bacterium]
MQFLANLMLLVASAGLPAGTPKGANDEVLAPPPGLVSLEGGRTQVGIEPKDVQELLDADPSLLPRVSSVDAETPRHT